MNAENPEPATPEEIASAAALDQAALEGMAAPPAAIEATKAERKIPTEELLKPLVGILCASVAPAWGIVEDEQQQLCLAYAAVIDKYFPEGLEFGPEITALIITGSIIVPRLGKPLREQKEAPPADEGAALQSAA